MCPLRILRSCDYPKKYSHKKTPRCIIVPFICDVTYMKSGCSVCRCTHETQLGTENQQMYSSDTTRPKSLIVGKHLCEKYRFVGYDILSGDLFPPFRRTELFRNVVNTLQTTERHILEERNLRNTDVRISSLTKTFGPKYGTRKSKALQLFHCSFE